MIPERDGLFQKQTNILGSNISIWDLNETVEKIYEFCERREKGYVCVSNVHTVVMGMQDPEYAAITNQAILATADGMPLVWASKILRHQGPAINGRASGPDILYKILTAERYRNLRHYFYGSTQPVLNDLAQNLHKIAPDAKLMGFFSPPMRPVVKATEPLSEEEHQECVRINEAAPDIVWVGLGAPKQEVWMYRARAHLTAPILVGVGAAFDFLSGKKSRAPLWMQKSGLEWLHRMMQEPGRLTSRYLKTNPLFVAAVLKQALLKPPGSLPNA